MPGPPVRTDIIEVYVFRRIGPRPAAVEFLQMRRAPTAVLAGSWQPIMGHLFEGERAAAGALRELREETGLPPAALLGFWQLEEVNSYFLHAAECLMLSPGFAAEVPLAWEPSLNHEHDAHRWVPRDHAERAFLWPGQRHAVAQMVRDILSIDAPAEAVLRIDPDSLPDGG